MTQDGRKTLNPHDIADRLYDIALDPEALESFIEAWNEAGLDTQMARQTVESIDQFDTSYKAHLTRAETFLARAGDLSNGPDLDSTLAPFTSLAAFIINRNLEIAASNSGARHAFGIEEGLPVSAMNLPREACSTVADTVQSLFASENSTDQLLKINFSELSNTGLFQLRKLSPVQGARAEHILVVTTRYYWQAALGDTLEEVFNLTSAEQGVVRGLVEGLDAKAIATERGTSEGTVRGQIKSVLAKMNARTQSEVIRLVLSLRDVSAKAQTFGRAAEVQAGGVPIRGGWLQDEVWKPFKTLTLPDGRRLDYHDMGPVTGAPVLYSHMGYCMARWHAPMLKLAFHSGLRVICPIRAGYGHSENIDPKADVLETTRADTLHLLDHLGIARLPYVTQGNDLIFAADLAAHHPDRVSEIIGICARPCLSGDRHYSGMAKWHRFFLSTGKHSPHLLKFTAKAAVTMAKRIGVEEMFRQMNQGSAADMAVFNDDDLRRVLAANAALIAGKGTNVAQAYTMEVLKTEADWSGLMYRCSGIRTWFINGGEDPAVDVSTIAEYREAYPWIEIEVIPGAGQLLIYQHYDRVIPKIAGAAMAARDAAMA